MKSASKIYPSVTTPSVCVNNREHNILVRQLVLKIKQLQRENKNLHEQLEHINKINHSLIIELNEKTLAINHLKQFGYHEVVDDEQECDAHNKS